MTASPNGYRVAFKNTYSETRILECLSEQEEAAVPRSREFDTDQALEDATKLFWQRGYNATSFDEIVKATGVSRYGIYDAFESKKGLYLAALARYYDQVFKQIFADMGPDARIEHIYQMFEDVLNNRKNPLNQNGCLMCNAANEMGMTDPEIQKKVKAFYLRIKKKFAEVIQNSVNRGELAADTDVQSKALVLIGTMQGGATFIRAGMPKKEIEVYFRTALDTLF